jgi:hypothetical protein
MTGGHMCFGRAKLSESDTDASAGRGLDRRMLVLAIRSLREPALGRAVINPHTTALMCAYPLPRRAHGARFVMLR